MQLYRIDLSGMAQDLELAREGDQYLIESFSKHFKKKQLLILNWCRLYLRVYRLSNIADGTRDQIYPLSYKGIRNN